MADYIYDPVETDLDTLEREAVEYIQGRWPDWTPNENNLEAWLISACVRIVAEARDLASEVPPAIFRYWGTTVVGLPPLDPTSALVSSTWTIVAGENPAGRTIEAGTWVLIPGSDGEPITFEVVSDITVAAGVYTTSLNEVQLRSLEAGEFTDGIGGNGVIVDLQDPIAWVEQITLGSPTAGGSDGETDEDYLDRLSSRLTLMTPRPILARDFELLAADIALRNGVVTRQVALDGYNPADDTDDNERMIAIAIIEDSTGDDLSAPLKSTIDSELQAMREVNFVVNMIDPTRTDVDVTFAGVAHPGFDAASVEAAAEAAVTEFLQPYNYGRPVGLEERPWVNMPVVRHQDISTVLNSVEGFSHWTSLTIGLNGGAQAATDQNLTGKVPLTGPGTVAGTVTGS